jgi:hypothetical protein
MRPSRFFLAVLAGLALGFWEVAVYPFLPPLLSMKPILATVVILLAASGRSRALTTALFAGAMTDLYALDTGDVATIRWAGLVLLLDLVVRQFLTHRSLYAAAALALVGRLIERATAWLFGWFALWIGAAEAVPTVWRGLGFVFLWDMVLVAVGFLAVAFFTRRFLTFDASAFRSV